ncbi:mechanosensitive ion channel family protein [Nanoarchaeota archaeon]
MIQEWVNQSATYYMGYVLPPNLINKWVIAAAIVILFAVLSKLFVWVIQKAVLGLTAKTKTKLDDMFVKQTNAPVSWLLIFIGLRIALEFLNIQSGIGAVITKTNNSLLYFSIIFLLVRIAIVFIDYWGERFAKKSKTKLDDILIPLFRKVVYVVGFIGMAIFILDAWGINIAGILAGVGIAGLALGFAVKDSLANIFGGISLIISKTFHIGDKIEADGHKGIIEEVGVRATRVRTFNNEILIIPNGIMANTVIKNYHQPTKKARCVIPFGVEYGTKIEKAKDVALAVAKSIKGIERKDPKPSVVFKEMADSSLNFELRFWVDDVDDVWPKKFEANEKMYNALNKAKIGIPFPCRTVYNVKG